MELTGLTGSIVHPFPTGTHQRRRWPGRAVVSDTVQIPHTRLSSRHTHPGWRLCELPRPANDEGIARTLWFRDVRSQITARRQCHCHPFHLRITGTPLSAVMGDLLKPSGVHAPQDLRRYRTARPARITRPIRRNAPSLQRRGRRPFRRRQAAPPALSPPHSATFSKAARLGHSEACSAAPNPS